MMASRPSAVLPLALVLALASTAVVRAADDDLIDLLQRKGVISAPEAKKVRRAPLNQEQRDGLVDMLHAKGVLSDAELARVTGKVAAPAPVVAAAPPSAPGAAVPTGSAAAPAKPSAQVGYEDGFFARTADGNWSIKLGGWVASNFLFYEPGTVQTNTQTIDRARLTLDVTMYKYFKRRVQNEFAVGSNGLRDAFLAVTPTPAFNIQVGQFKIPFSYEGLLSKKCTRSANRVADSGDGVGYDASVWGWSSASVAARKGLAASRS